MMRLCLVEDDGVAGLEPLTLTRPAFDLRLGASTIGEKIARALGIGPGPARRGVVIRPYLATVQRLRDPQAAVNDPEWLARAPVVVANSRWVPPAGFDPPESGSTWLGTCDGLPACAWVGPERAVGLEPGFVDGWFEALMARAHLVELGGQWIKYPWDLVGLNAEHLARDFDEVARPGVTNRHLANAALVGPADRLSVHETVRVDPYTVFDTTGGPIVIEAGAVVQPFTRIEGPCFIGRQTQLLRANLRGGVTIGPNCRIGGEVEQAIVHGHANKSHDGFLGHAYVGEWVDLGANTSNSDQRNDCGEVAVPLSGDPVATGRQKVGCFLGDYTRTGVGSLINAGASVGVMCNLLPAGRLLPKYVPSFAAVLHGRVAAGPDPEDLFATARTVKDRRGAEFTRAEERLFLDLHERTRLDRERAIRAARDRRVDHRPLAARGR